MREFIIDEKNADIRLDKFMARVMPTAKTSEIYKALRKKKVRVNGKHEEGAYRLAENDSVAMYISDEFFEADKSDYAWLKASTEINVVYEDKNILIADKPSGMPSQDIDGDTDSLESRIRAYLYKKDEIDLDATPLFIPSLCHRIDRNTDGLVIAAKNSAALRILNEKIKNREVRKFYLCEAERTPSPKAGTIQGWLLKDGQSRKVLFYKEKRDGAVFCKSEYKTIKSGEPALIEVELLTGRTHQIRAGLSHIGCPLVGDVKYGAKSTNEDGYQHLTSYKIVFNFKSDSGILDYLKDKTITKKC